MTQSNFFNSITKVAVTYAGAPIDVSTLYPPYTLNQPDGTSFTDADLNIYDNQVLQTGQTQLVTINNGGATITPSATLLPNIQTGDSILITRYAPMTQPVQLESGFTVAEVNENFNNLYGLLSNSLGEIASRCLQIGIADNGITIETTQLPAAPGTLPINRSMNILGWDATGNIDYFSTWASQYITYTPSGQYYLNSIAHPTFPQNITLQNQVNAAFDQAIFKIYTSGTNINANVELINQTISNTFPTAVNFPYPGTIQDNLITINNLATGGGLPSASYVAYAPTSNNAATNVQDAITNNANVAANNASTKADKINGAIQISDPNAYPIYLITAGQVQSSITSAIAAKDMAQDNQINGNTSSINNINTILASFVQFGATLATLPSANLPAKFGAFPLVIVKGNPINIDGSGNLIVPTNAINGSLATFVINGELSNANPTTSLRFVNIGPASAPITPEVIGGVFNSQSQTSFARSGLLEVAAVRDSANLVVQAGDRIQFQAQETGAGTQTIISFLVSFEIRGAAGGTIINTNTLLSSGVNGYTDGTTTTVILDDLLTATQFATATTSGTVSTASQTFAGTKTFNGGAVIPPGQTLNLEAVAPNSMLIAGPDPDNAISGLSPGPSGYVPTSNGSTLTMQPPAGASFSSGSVSWSLNGGSVNFSSLGKTGNEVNIGFSVNHAGGLGSGTQFGILPSSHKINGFYSTSGEGGGGVAPNFKYFASGSAAQNASQYSMFWIYNLINIQSQSGMSSNGNGQIRSTNSWIHS